MNQNVKQDNLIHNDVKNLSLKEIFEEIFGERFDEIIEITDVTNFNDLMHYFKGDTSRKTIDDFVNGIKFEKIKPADMKLN